MLFDKQGLHPTDLQRPAIATTDHTRAYCARWILDKQSWSWNAQIIHGARRLLAGSGARGGNG